MTITVMKKKNCLKASRTFGNSECARLLLVLEQRGVVRTGGFTARTEVEPAKIIGQQV